MRISQPLSIEKLSWPVYSYAILFLCVLFQVLQWPLLPKFLDIYYHLSVMKGFADAGGYVTRAFWEYAPSGRPHLYPPALHCLMLFLYKTGLAPITVGRLVDCASYPLFLFSFYRFISKTQTPRAAFLSLLLLSSVISVSLASVTLSAFNLSAVFGLWALGFVSDRKSLGGALCLGLCFYTHTLGAWLFLFVLIFYALLRREETAVVLRAAAGALLLAAPFLAYQFYFRDYFAFVKVHEYRLWEFDVLTLVLTVASIFYFARERSLRKIAFPLALLAGFSPLIMTHPIRFFSGHGLMGAALLAALLVDSLLDSWEKKVSSGKLLAGFVVFVLFTMFVSPFFEWNFKEGKGRWAWGDRTVTRYLLPDEKRNFRAQGFSIYFPEDYAKIVEAVRAHSGPDDILWTDFSYTAGIFGVLADRATSCGMLAEVKPFEKRDPMKDARILVWFKDKEGRATPEMRASIEKRHLSVIQETEMAFVLLNPEGYAKSSRPRALVPTAVLTGLLIFTTVLLWVFSRMPCGSI